MMVNIERCSTSESANRQHQKPVNTALRGRLKQLAKAKSAGLGGFICRLPFSLNKN